MVVLHLATKAFWPGRVPIELLHVDTGHNFDEVLAFRDATVERLGLHLQVASVQSYIDDGRLRERPDGMRNTLQTVPLLDGITRHGYDVVFGGARRDEEKARAKERVVSLRDEFGQWIRATSALNSGTFTTRATCPVSTCGSSRSATGPKLDVWRYIERENIALPSLYYAHERPVFSRDGMWLTPHPAVPISAADAVETKTVGYRTVGGRLVHGRRGIGCRHGRRRSSPKWLRRASPSAAPLARMIGRSEAAMEDRKKEGYF